MTKQNVLALLAAVVVVTVGGTSCTGRAPSISKLDNDPVVTPPPPPPPPPPTVRQLVDKKLFGTMPVQNRFQDPLMTFTGTGWFAYANDFQSYPTVKRHAAASPTNTAFIAMPADGSATLLGQFKTEQVPLHVEVWLGCKGDGCDPASPGASMLGLYDGGSETSTPLTADASSKTTIGDITWEKLTADVASGPIGWAFLMSGAPFVGGPVAVDVPSNANTDFVSARSRPLNTFERALLDDIRQRTHQLRAPKSPTPATL